MDRERGPMTVAAAGVFFAFIIAAGYVLARSCENEEPGSFGFPTVAK